MEHAQHPRSPPAKGLYAIPMNCILPHRHEWVYMSSGELESIKSSSCSRILSWLAKQPQLHGSRTKFRRQGPKVQNACLDEIVGKIILDLPVSPGQRLFAAATLPLMLSLDNSPQMGTVERLLFSNG